MDMVESPEEFMGSSNDHGGQIIKGKRTKRQRPSSPLGMAVTSSSSSGGGGVRGGGYGGDDCSIPSPAVSGETYYESTTEEEEDMANCLILLAQGDHHRPIQKQDYSGIKVADKFKSRKFAELATTATASTTSKAGFYVYQCKTCNRTFPSFQALGGHRASHKKPKLPAAATVVEEKKQVTVLSLRDEHQGQFSKIGPMTTTFSLQNSNKSAFYGNNNKASKIHECSICGSEFSSGQALGGHMRRHRSVANTQIALTMETSLTDDQSHEEDKRRNILALDLNLPAPEDHDHSKFQFASSNQSPLVFATPALVDCHY